MTPNVTNDMQAMLVQMRALREQMTSRPEALGVEDAARPEPMNTLKPVGQSRDFSSLMTDALQSVNQLQKIPAALQTTLS